MEASVEQEESYRYRQERKKNAPLYMAMVVVIVLGFYITEPFSVESMIPAAVALFWGIGIARQGKFEEKYLLTIKPELDRLMAAGVPEHDAMKQLGCDKFYYKPFWAIF
jgi:Ni,Fe-hydrogenase I cytochrome b subunit